MKSQEITPSLFGIKYSNRDFTKEETWGKNQFNSSFPAALVAFMCSKEIKPVYITVDENNVIQHTKISTDDLFGISPLSENIFYAFESIYTPFQVFYKGNIPRIDLVILDKEKDICLKGLEIKLTALPDNSTCELSEDSYSSELVIRPDTISYLACSISKNFKANRDILKMKLSKFDHIKNWEEERDILEIYPQFVECIIDIIKHIPNKQQPLILQPVWKTNGKSPSLAEKCLDAFVWSDLAVIHLFVKFDKLNPSRIGRTERTLVWLIKMLYEFANEGQFNASEIIDKLSYNTRNDKAFSVNGQITYPLLKSQELKQPRISKNDIKNIILGGGQNLLSPERRFDAIIYNSPDLFK